jgi:hypothetical protein
MTACEGGRTIELEIKATEAGRIAWWDMTTLGLWVKDMLTFVSIADNN